MRGIAILKATLFYAVYLGLLFIIPGNIIKEQSQFVLPVLFIIFIVTAIHSIMKDLKADLLTPRNIFICLLSSYTLVLPGMAYLTLIFDLSDKFNNIFEIFFNLPITSYALYLSLIALISFLLGYSIINVGKKGANDQRNKVNPESLRLFIFAMAILSAFYLCLFLLSVYKIGVSDYLFNVYSPDGIDVSFWGLNVFALESLFTMLLIWAIIVLNSRDPVKNLAAWLVISVLILLLSLTSLTHGSRIFVFSLLLSLLIIYNNYRKQIKFRHAIVISLLAIMSFSFIGIYRSTRGDAGNVSSADMFHSIFWESGLNYYTFMQKLQLFEVSPSTDRLNYRSFLDIFKIMLPRLLNPDKESSLYYNKWLAEQNDALYVPFSFASFVLGELYINGGKMAIMIFFVILGAACSFIYANYLVRNDLISQILFFIGIPLLLVHVLRDPIAITTKLFIQNVLFIAFIVHLLVPNKRSEAIK